MFVKETSIIGETNVSEELSASGEHNASEDT